MPLFTQLPSRSVLGNLELPVYRVLGSSGLAPKIVHSGDAPALRRVARLGDGWLASAYNTTPEAFAAARRRIAEHLHASGKDPDRFPNAIATMFFFVTEERATSERIVREVLSPTLNRPEEELRERLLIGSAEECAEKLATYRAAGANRIFLWPVEDELRQLATFQEQVAPLVGR
jgi:alkanesulfonate monooxygenase SsuD/methylene tetrahydromethanopterin reductase-like flavin-dependent oxidoreductase (luciferase family)